MISQTTNHTMKDAPTLPDMSKEQSAELRQLRSREIKLSRGIDRTTLRNRARSRVIDGLIARKREQLEREMMKALKAFAKPLRAEQRQLERLSTQTEEDRTPETRELKAIRRRIAVLEGRMAS